MSEDKNKIPENNKNNNETKILVNPTIDDSREILLNTSK